MLGQSLPKRRRAGCVRLGGPAGLRFAQARGGRLSGASGRGAVRLSSRRRILGMRRRTTRRQKLSTSRGALIAYHRR